jgi:UDP-N-acetylbacillosamine N-acetyltransferase
VRPKLVIWGAGAHARVVAEIARLSGEYELAGFLDDVHAERHGTQFDGVPILGGREQLDRLRQHGVEHLMLGFGRCEARLRLSALVRERGYRLATLVHPRAIVGTGVAVGEGTVIKGGAVIDIDVRVGANVIVAPSCIGHGCVLEDGVLVSTGASLAGRVVVGRGSCVGTGASVSPRVRIGAGCLIGVGAVVVRHIPDGFVAYGVPARPMRRVTPADDL